VGNNHPLPRKVVPKSPDSPSFFFPFFLHPLPHRTRPAEIYRQTFVPPPPLPGRAPWRGGAPGKAPGFPPGPFLVFVNSGTLGKTDATTVSPPPAQNLRGPHANPPAPPPFRSGGPKTTSRRVPNLFLTVVTITRFGRPCMWVCPPPPRAPPCPSQDCPRRTPSPRTPWSPPPDVVGQQNLPEPFPPKSCPRPGGRGCGPPYPPGPCGISWFCRGFSSPALPKIEGKALIILSFTAGPSSLPLVHAMLFRYLAVQTPLTTW